MNYDEKHAELTALHATAEENFAAAWQRALKAKCREQRKAAQRRVDYWRNERARLEQEMQGLDYAQGEALASLEGF